MWSPKLAGLGAMFVLAFGIPMSGTAATDCDGRFTCAGPARDTAPVTQTVRENQDSTFRTLRYRGSVIWPMLTFEGLNNLEEIEAYYAGGLGGEGSGPGPEYGITFSDNALAVISQEAGGTGDFANNPSGDTTMAFATGSSATLNVPDGFEVGFSFFYSAAQHPGEVIVYEGIDATGNILATLSLPVTPSTGATPYLFDNWQPLGVEFEGIARSVDFGGTTDLIGFDNIILGTEEPDVLFHDRFEE